MHTDKTLIFNTFSKAVIEQDERNKFCELDFDIENYGFPKDYYQFIKKFNPVDVEIVLSNLISIVLIPYQELPEAQKEYNLGNNYFVFASINGDPLVFKKRAVLRGIHGQGIWTFTHEANSFIAFIEEILKDLMK
jgi:hypothetical protein